MYTHFHNLGYRYNVIGEQSVAIYWNHFQTSCYYEIFDQPKNTRNIIINSLKVATAEQKPLLTWRT
uniref:SFRICE_006675 n=1 Tax=Spodoptera frugiperda TaxID=7108 RepID=A0A2H1VHH0_SPOFR